MPQSGVRSGLLLAVLGLWVLLRTINQDATKRTLIDHLTGKKAAGGNSGPVSALTPGAPATGVGATVSAAAGLVDTPGGGTATGKAPTHLNRLGGHIFPTAPTNSRTARGLAAVGHL